MRQSVQSIPVVRLKIDRWSLARTWKKSEGTEFMNSCVNLSHCEKPTALTMFVTLPASCPLVSSKGNKNNSLCAFSGTQNRQWLHIMVLNVAEESQALSTTWEEGRTFRQSHASFEIGQRLLCPPPCPFFHTTPFGRDMLLVTTSLCKIRKCLNTFRLQNCTPEVKCAHGFGANQNPGGPRAEPPLGGAAQDTPQQVVRSLDVAHRRKWCKCKTNGARKLSRVDDATKQPSDREREKKHRLGICVNPCPSFHTSLSF